VDRVPPALKGYLTINGAAEDLDVTPRTIYRAMGEGTLRYTKVGKVRYTRADWVREHVELCARGGRDPASESVESPIAA
jgi:excisionase family DNA binding protein